MQAGQFSRTQGLRRKLKEPSSAGQSPAASLSSQRTTSNEVSNRESFIPFVCHKAHVHVKQNEYVKNRRNARVSALFCVSRQKLARPSPSLTPRRLGRQSKLASFCRET